MRLLVTGGAGFIGSNFVRAHLEAHPTDQVVVLDRLTYAGNLQNLAGLERFPGFRFVRGDICEPDDVEKAFAECGDVDALIHLAAESHVDRSIHDASPFVRTNVLGTQVLLDTARARGIGLFVCVSTDEIYGSLEPGDPPFTEESPAAPNSPYSASKAGGDLLARAWHVTYGLPVVTVRASNTYGPYQFPEKLLPLLITHALDGQPLPIYGDGRYVRDWMHVSDLCDALERIVRGGRPGAVYNVGGHCERENIGLARAICAATGRPESLIRHVGDRPGHDRRYALATDRIERELGWKPGPPIEARLDALVRWYADHRDWWEAIKSGEYRTFYERHYGGRLTPRS